MEGSGEDVAASHRIFVLLAHVLVMFSVLFGRLLAASATGSYGLD